MFVIDKVTNNDRLTFTVEDSASFKLRDVKIDSKDRVINAKPIKSWLRIYFFGLRRVMNQF